MKYVTDDADVPSDAPEKTLKNLKIWNTKESNDVNFASISNWTTVAQLKEKYLNEVGKDADCWFMYGGREIQDKNTLGSYNVADDMVIICMYKN